MQHTYAKTDGNANETQAFNKKQKQQKATTQQTDKHAFVNTYTPQIPYKLNENQQQTTLEKTANGDHPNESIASQKMQNSL